MNKAKHAVYSALGIVMALALAVLLLGPPATSLAAHVMARDAASPALATLSGHVYEGDAINDPASIPLGGVTVRLYGSGNANQIGTAVLDTDTTAADGSYALDVPTASRYLYFNVVETNPAGYISVGAVSSNRGAVVKSADWIQFQPGDLSGALTGNNFWDRWRETPTPTATATRVPPTRTPTATATRALPTRTPTATLPPSDSPCLEGDPFNFEDFLTIVRAETPPRGVQVVHPHMSVEWIGQGQLGQWQPVMPIGETSAAGAQQTADEPPPQDTLYREVQLAMINTRTENEFRVIMDQDLLDVVLACHEDSGLTSASEGCDEDGCEDIPRLFLPLLWRVGESGSTAAAAAAGPQGWSNGVDSRIMFSGTTAFPWRTISQFRYGNIDESRCTGTLIGPRHLVTAGHCIYNRDTASWGTIQVAPAKNGVGNEPYGVSEIKPNPDPGTEAWYFTPWQFRDPNITPAQWDFGLIVVPDRLGDLTGWMGYVARPAAELSGAGNLNRGYPLCDNDRFNEPANCQDARLYGDVNVCSIGNLVNQGPDGWYRQIKVSCDISAGHSGSAVYHYFYDSTLDASVPVVSMVITHESCATCSWLDFWPNTCRRITPGELATISWLRETFS